MLLQLLIEGSATASRNLLLARTPLSPPLSPWPLAAGLRLLQDSTPPDHTKPCVASSTGSYMTAVSKCPNDAFFVSFMRSGSTAVSALGADATPVRGTVKHQWLGPNLGGSTQSWQQPGMYVAVLRASDGKLVVPKGVAADGVTPVDISGTKHSACQLFKQGSSPLRFAAFRARLSNDGAKVVRNDFGSKPNEYLEGLACEKYAEVLVGDGSSTAVGRMTDVYKPPSCLFVIDDCSA